MKLPQQCCVCHQSGDLVCQDCLRHLNPYPDITNLEDTPGLTWLIVGRHYTKLIRHLVHRLKYGRWISTAPFLWSKLANIIHTSDLIQQIQLHPWQVVITAVPTHRVKRYLTRGYNQAQLLAQSIADSLDLPYVDLLSKSRRTTSQVRVSDRSRRLTNILNSFSSSSPNLRLYWSHLHPILNLFSPHIDPTPNNSHPSLIILVDDIITTWATINECTRILHDHYPHAQVRWVCISRNR